MKSFLFVLLFVPIFVPIAAFASPTGGVLFFILYGPIVLGSLIAFVLIWLIFYSIFNKLTSSIFIGLLTIGVITALLYSIFPVARLLEFGPIIVNTYLFFAGILVLILFFRQRNDQDVTRLWWTLKYFMISVAAILLLSYGFPQVNEMGARTVVYRCERGVYYTYPQKLFRRSGPIHYSAGGGTLADCDSFESSEKHCVDARWFAGTCYKN